MLRLFRRAQTGPVQRTAADFALAGGGTLHVRFTPHPRARRLRIAVGDDGVRVTVPPRVSDRSVDEFVRAHIEWIEMQLARFSETEVVPLRVRESLHMPLRGELLSIDWHRGKTDRVWREHATLHVQVRDRDESRDAASPSLKRAFKDFYVQEGRTDVARWLPALAEATGHSPLRVGFKTMRSQWGSMSSSGAMALELSLVLGRPSAFRYVLVHELCHMVHHNHSPAYWREVEKHFPDWKTERDYLHTHGRAIKAGLAAIIA